MWTVDARCPSCAEKTTCTDRAELYGTLSSLANKLNGEEFSTSPGDGIIIIACQGFTTRPQS